MPGPKLCADDEIQWLTSLAVSGLYTNMTGCYYPDMH